jgi:hypothetical protein
MERKDNVPHLDGIATSKAPTDASAVPADAPLPAANSPAEPALAPPAPGLSNSEEAELLEHGDALLRNGDAASARLSYERSASDGRAALRRPGATFDPEFLGRLGLGNCKPIRPRPDHGTVALSISARSTPNVS